MSAIPIDDGAMRVRSTVLVDRPLADVQAALARTALTSIGGGLYSISLRGAQGSTEVTVTGNLGVVGSGGKTRVRADLRVVPVANSTLPLTALLFVTPQGRRDLRESWGTDFLEELLQAGGLGH